MSAYRRDFDKTKYKSFLIKDNELLEKYNELWKKVRNNIKNGFDSEPVYNEKYLKSKVNSYKENINIHSHNNKTPRQCTQCICLSVI